GTYGTWGWGALRSSPGIGPLTAALSAVPAQRAADKSKPPPCRRETREIRAASLDHLNDPLPRGSSADSGGMSSLATGHAAHRGSRLRRSAFAPSSSPASTIVGSGYPQFSSLRALGLSSGRHTHAQKAPV